MGEFARHLLLDYTYDGHMIGMVAPVQRKIQIKNGLFNPIASAVNGFNSLMVRMIPRSTKNQSLINTCFK